MRRIQRMRLFAVALTLTLSCQTWAQMAKSLEVKEQKLSNGMTVWLNEDHSQPKVFGAVVVNAGAKDCPNTGIAHYFEHIMFKGTDEIGTIDYAQEKPWLDSIAAAYDRLSTTKDEAQRTAIQKDINRLSQKAGEFAIPNEFNTLISRYGGSGLNAGTSYDFTFYYNMFTSQYMEQWCQLNSDRLVNPVFRMFQGELETVYEEKNRASDNMTTSLRETVFKELFGTQPYAYPVIGSTENLKNPKLSDMKRFYEQYYVGSNMGIILCGDFQADSIMPLLERTFGRIPQGVKPVRKISTMPDIQQERTIQVKLPVPLVSMEMLAFKGVTDYEKDANALAVASKMLSNGNAGLLDSLMNEGSLMAGVLTPASLNDAGALLLIVVPNLLSKAQKAENACVEQMKRIANGDFSDDAFTSQKQEAYREAFKELETIDKRALQMVNVMSSGHTWQQYIDKINAIDRLTKADVVAAANHYFNQPFLRFKKKYGNADKDKMSQPGYRPVKPKNRGAESAYAKRLATMPVNEVEPRLIDFNRDATISSLGGQATLYTVKNPVNDLFQFTINFNRGERADARLSAAAALLNAIGTDSLTRQQLGAALQAYGADMSFESSANSVSMTVTGVDKNFDATMQLVGHFMRNLKSDDKALKKVKDALKAEEKSLTEENSDVMSAMIQKIALGSNSRFLHRLTYPELKKMNGEELIEAFNTALTSNWTVKYSGTLTSREVEAAVKKNLPVERSQKAFVDYSQEVVGYSEPTVYVFDMPKSRQTLLVTYDQMKPMPTLANRVPARLLEQYVGGGMSSVLFQEVREFRSMAYSTQSILSERSLKLHPQSPLGFFTYTGTQGDKTMSAIALVDSLLRNMPMMDKTFQSSRQELINDINNDFPSFRGMASAIASQRLEGYTSDKKTGLYSLLKNATIDDLRRCYEANIKDNAAHRVLGIVGNKKKLDLKELEKYGKVVFLKESDLFKK